MRPIVKTLAAISLVAGVIASVAALAAFIAEHRE